MKIKDVCTKNGYAEHAFLLWLKDAGYGYDVSLAGSFTFSKSADVAAIVAENEAHLAPIRAAAAVEAEARAIEDQQKQQALSSMLISSGFNFDGYTITKYSGYISGDDAVSVNRPTQDFWGSVNGHVGADLMDSLAVIRRNALAELKEAAYALGCNAVVGVDFDYLTLDPETASSMDKTVYLPFLFAVTANGNAVVIEKN